MCGGACCRRRVGKHPSLVALVIRPGLECSCRIVNTSLLRPHQQINRELPRRLSSASTEHTPLTRHLIPPQKSDPAIDCRRAIEQNPTDRRLHPTAVTRPTVPRHQTHRTLDLPTIYPLLPTCRLLPAPLVLPQLPQRWRWLLQRYAYTGRPFGAARKQDSQWHTDCPYSTSRLQLDRAVSLDLPAVDGDCTSLDYELALTACSIITGNTEGYLARREDDAQTPFSPIQCSDGMLRPGTYFTA